MLHLKCGWNWTPGKEKSSRVDSNFCCKRILFPVFEDSSDGWCKKFDESDENCRQKEKESFDFDLRIFWQVDLAFLEKLDDFSRLERADEVNREDDEGPHGQGETGTHGSSQSG